MKNANPVWMLSLLLLAATGAQAAKVYSWTDSQGVVHYTDAPPPARKPRRSICASPPSSAVHPARCKLTTSTA